LIVLKKNNLKNIVFLFILFISLLVVIIGLSSKRTDINSQNGWTLQTNLQTLLRGRTVNDMVFIDSLTGFAVTNGLSQTDTCFILKTTNGGNNWFVNYWTNEQFANALFKIIFPEYNVGYICGGGGTSFICKTTDRGITWLKTSVPFTLSFIGMSCINKDTVYVVNSESMTGGIFRTTNGGTNWQPIYSAGLQNPQNIYFYNARIGFYCSPYSKLFKTTDGGYNWNVLDNNNGFYDIKFIDSLTGFRTIFDVQKTTNGGLNWTTQILPVLPGGTTYNGIVNFNFLNQDTIFAVGSQIEYGPSPYRYRGIINKTTNGGLNWGYQLPDTQAVQITYYYYVKFINSKFGWTYTKNGKGIYTTTGGDTTLYTNINEQINIVSKDFKLFQNYPNPFNPTTNIKVKFNKRGFAELKIFDITGKLLDLLINKYENPGEYVYSFDAKKLSSGVYFYSLFVDGMRVDTKKLMLIK
jgi:photosystem II stability/assembly factor-like uncharacterized protein